MKNIFFIFLLFSSVAIGQNVNVVSRTGVQGIAPGASDSTKKNTDSIATKVAIRDSALLRKQSLIFPTRYSYRIIPNLTNNIGSNILEILNLGNTGTTDSIAINKVGLVNINGRIDLIRNMEWDSVNSKWNSPIKGATGYGSACVEAGGEAVILHATKAGDNFSDVPHEILSASANGTDGPTGQKITSGYFTQSKAPLFLRWDSAAYDAAQTNNVWNNTLTTQPLFWASAARHKGTDNELYRAETNSTAGWPAYYAAKSRGTLGTKTTITNADTLGRYGWKGYDGTNDQITASIDGFVSGTVSAGNVPGNIRFSTSPSGTSGLRRRLEITADSLMNLYNMPQRGEYPASLTTIPSYSGVGFSPAITTSTAYEQRALSATTGGFLLNAFSTTSNTASAILIRGIQGGTTPSVANTIYRAIKWNGTNNFAAIASSEIGWQWDNNGTVVSRMLGDGSFQVGGTGSPTDKLEVTGNIALTTAGNKIKIATGTNASAGLSGAMTAGTITISTTAVTVNSIIILTPVGAGSGQISLGTKTAGTSFVINSSDGADTRTVQWIIIN